MTNNTSAQILHFPQRYPQSKEADKNRIICMHLYGRITFEEMQDWLKKGGHV